MAALSSIGENSGFAEREIEKGNQDGTSTTEKELLKRKGTPTLRNHLTKREISQDGGTSTLPRKAQQLN